MQSVPLFGKVSGSRPNSANHTPKTAKTVYPNICQIVNSIPTGTHPFFNSHTVNVQPIESILKYCNT